MKNVLHTVSILLLFSLLAEISLSASDIFSDVEEIELCDTDESEFEKEIEKIDYQEKNLEKSLASFVIISLFQSEKEMIMYKDKLSNYYPTKIINPPELFV